MEEVEQLRADTKKALALLVHSMGAAIGAKTMLLSMHANWKASVRPGADATGLDELVLAMLLPLSSAAVKQYPQDPEVRSTYEDLRPGARH